MTTERCAQVLVLPTAALPRQEADDILIIAILSDPLDLITARAGTPTLLAA